MGRTAEKCLLTDCRWCKATGSTGNNGFSSEGIGTSIASKAFVVSIIRPPTISHTRLQAAVEKYGSSAPGMIYCIIHALLRAVSIHLAQNIPSCFA